MCFVLSLCVWWTLVCGDLAPKLIRVFGVSVISEAAGLYV